MADTYITCTVSPCQIVTTLDIPLLNLTPADGLQISIAILGVWAIGFCFRAIIKVLNMDSVQTEN